MSLLAYCSVVSNRGLLGTVFSSLRRIHETAVSCNRISCMCPGYTLALSPISTLARDLEASRGPLEASLDAGLEARSVSNNTMRAMWHSDLEASRGPLEAGVEAGLEARSVSNNTMRATRRSDLEASRGPLEAGLERASRPDPYQIILRGRCGTTISRPLEALSRPASRRASRPDSYQVIPCGRLRGPLEALGDSGLYNTN